MPPSLPSSLAVGLLPARVYVHMLGYILQVRGRCRPACLYIRSLAAGLLPARAYAHILGYILQARGRCLPACRYIRSLAVGLWPARVHGHIHILESIQISRDHTCYHGPCRRSLRRHGARLRRHGVAPRRRSLCWGWKVGLVFTRPGGFGSWPASSPWPWPSPRPSPLPGQLHSSSHGHRHGHRQRHRLRHHYRLRHRHRYRHRLGHGRRHVHACRGGAVYIWARRRGVAYPAGLAVSVSPCLPHILHSISNWIAGDPGSANIRFKPSLRCK